MLYEKFITEKIEDGVLKGIEFHVPENYNFAYDVVDEIARLTPDKRAAIWVSNEGEERFYSYSDVSKRSNQVANYFLSLGIKKGDRVMLVLKRHIEFWFSILALHKIGAIAIPATNQLMEKDYVYRFEAAGVKAIVCTSDGVVASEVERAEIKIGRELIKIIVGKEREGFLSFGESQKFSDDFERRETQKDEIMLMYFTSGTTGYPKIAMHAHTYSIGHFVTAKWWHEIEPDGIHFTVSDTGWGKAAWGKIYGQWLMESCVFIYDFDRFDPSKVLSMIAKHGVTTFCAPPTMYRFFIKEDLSAFDLSSLRHATIAGEALNPEVFRRFKAATGLSLMEGFGQTETTLTVANLHGTTPKPGSMGKPTPQYHVELMRPDGTFVETGEVGEIVIECKNPPYGLFKGYYNDKEKTDEVWYDGWYHTGDTAWKDEDGYFWYEGRVDDLIKSSGYRIGPFEIESTLMEHPSVLECAVTGAPDPIRGQVVKATIVLAKGYAPSEELKKEIQVFVKEHTAPYKYPRVVEFVDELPKTASGKIRRTALRNADNANGNS